MLGSINLRMYIAIGVIVGVIVYLIGLVAGDSIVPFFLDIRNTALSNGIAPSIVTLIVEPWVFAFSNPAPGAVMAGLLWPLIIVWLVLLFLVIIISAFTSGYNSAATGVDQMN